MAEGYVVIYQDVGGREINIITSTKKTKKAKNKAWFVWADNYYEWGDFVHGGTATVAKSRFFREWESEGVDWIDLRPQRIPELDGKKLTMENIKQFCQSDWFQSDICCDCDLCQDEIYDT